MKKNVIKRGRGYSYVIELPPDENGRRKQKWVSGFSTAKEAQQAYAEARTAQARGAFTPPTRVTLSQFVQETWLPSVRPTLRESTYKSYARNLRLYLLPALGGRRLTAIDAGDLNALYGELLLTGGRKGTGLAPRSVQYIHMILHRVYADAVRWGKAPRNVADAADPPRIRSVDRNRHMKVWGAPTLAQFLTGTADDRMRPLWVLLASTGMRRGEALGLRWQDVDLDGAVLSVVQTLIDADDDVILGAPKTARGRRAIALDSTTATVLRTWRAVQAKERLALGPDYVDNGLVFTREDGSPMQPKSVSKAFQRRAKRLGLQVIRLHDLRHTHATLALQAGVHPKIVSERLGHASVAITLDTYSHVLPDMQADAAELVSRLIFEIPATGPVG